MPYASHSSGCMAMRVPADRPRSVDMLLRGDRGQELPDCLVLEIDFRLALAGSREMPGRPARLDRLELRAGDVIGRLACLRLGIEQVADARQDQRPGPGIAPRALS